MVPQGVLFGHNSLAFYVLLGLIADMRTVGSRKQSIVRTRRPVQYIGLSRTDLPDSMVRRLVEQILKLPPRPLAHTKLEREILELQKVGNRLSTFQLHARLTCVLCADDFLGEDVARAARGVRVPRHRAACVAGRSWPDCPGISSRSAVNLGEPLLAPPTPLPQPGQPGLAGEQLLTPPRALTPALGRCEGNRPAAAMARPCPAARCHALLRGTGHIEN